MQSGLFQSATKMAFLRKLPGVLLVVFVILLFVQLAETGWSVVDVFYQPVSSTRSMSATSQSGLPTQKKSLDYQALSNMHLFGENEAGLVIGKGPVTAPETRLNLILYGVFAGDTLKKGSAIIGSKTGKQKQYKVGSKVDSGVWLAEVRKDHVLLKRGGSYELLKFPKQSTDGINIKKNTKPVVQFKAGSNKQNFLDNVRIIPVFAGKGKGLKGYRILPKKNRAVYNRLGLKPSDIVTSINGISLSNEREAMRVISELVKSDQVVVEVERSGQLQTMTLNLK